MQIQDEDNYKSKQENSSRVKVAVRIRPLTEKEIGNHQKKCTQQVTRYKLQIGKQRQFTFDRVFSAETQQEQIYKQCVQDLVSKCFQGYNSAVLAYGQTGSGKTYTMGTGCTNINSGILPRVINSLFQQIDKKNKQADFVVKVTFLQIYNEQIIDLLSNQNVKGKKNSSSATIRQQKDGSISVYGITQEKVNSAEQLMDILQKGSLQRSTCSTLMNQSSSRSHAIFSIFIEQHLIQDLVKGKLQQQGFMTAKFHFVDLAGSQRAKKTGATGSILREGININMGLLCLGNVISALTDQERSTKFIPYRDSKLTRILQDSLGGNSNTYMIACVSPAQSNFQQTLNTLKYASRAMNIKNKPVINRDPQSALISQLKQRVYELEVENRKLRNITNKNNIDEILGDKKSLRDSKYEDGNDNSDAIKKNNINLQKKIQSITIELQKQKKKNNQVQIQNYELKRDRQILKIKLDQILRGNPNVILPDVTETVNALDIHLATIQQLKIQLNDKQKLYNQLQTQYQYTIKQIKNQQAVLIQKNRQVYNLKKEIVELVKESCSKLRSARASETPKQKYSVNKSMQQQILEQEDQLEMDEQFLNQSLKYVNTNKNTEKHIQQISNGIGQRQKMLKQMTNNQIDLQYRLIMELKQQYHGKISNLQKQKEKLQKQLAGYIKKDTSLQKDKVLIGLKNKKDSLESQLKQFKKKQKQQQGLQKMVQSQKQIIRQLTSQIKLFKSQKLQLAKKLKQDKDNFQKFKLARCKELLDMKRKNQQKQNQIKKLSKQNQKNLQNILKKDQQFKRLKRANQTLKQILQPKTKAYHTRSRDHSQSLGNNNSITPFINFENIINKIMTQILYDLDKQGQITKYQTIINNLKIQIPKCIDRISKLNIEKQRLKYREQKHQKQYELQTLIKNSNQILQQLQQKLKFNKLLLKQLIESQQNNKLDLDGQIIYNKNYDNVDYLRKIIKILFQKIIIILKQQINIKNINFNFKNQIQMLQNYINQLEQQSTIQRNQHQQSLSKLRDQLLMRSYINIQQINNNPIINSATHIKKICQENGSKIDRKFYQKKISDLNKKIRNLGMECQQLRRKCEVISQKYQNIKKLGNKDRFIGIPRQQFQDIKIPTLRQKRLEFQRSLPLQTPTNIILEQVTNSLQNITNHYLYNKNRSTDIVQQNQEQLCQTNQWQNLGSFEGHHNPILSITNFNNLLYSSSTRNIKIWDIQNQKLIHDLSGKDLNGFVKSIIIQPERKLLASTCNQNITLWDLSTMQPISTLKGHKDQVRVMHINNNILYSGGKGLPTSGSIFSWDFRSTTFLQQKQRNQDVFSMTSHNNILYYGSRNHQVRRINLETMDTLTSFQHPHFDTVTSMTHLKHYLVSGSKDKNLKLWQLDSLVNNYRSTSYGHNDINTIQRDNYFPIFYSGSRDGQVRVGTVFKDKIQFVGKIDCHSQSVNSISCIEQNNILATGSTDKLVKLWKPTKQTLLNLQNDSIYYD